MPDRSRHPSQRAGRPHLGSNPRPDAETPQALPKRGSIHRQRVRCGHAACHCAAGELHGPYPYLFWRENGKLRKRYLRLEVVDNVRAAARHRLQDVMVAIHHRKTLDESHEERRPNAEFYLRSPAEQAKRFAAYHPEAATNSVRIARPDSCRSS